MGAAVEASWQGALLLQVVPGIEGRVAIASDWPYKTGKKPRDVWRQRFAPCHISKKGNPHHGQCFFWLELEKQ